MKDSKKSAVQICGFSLLISLVYVVLNRFGTFPYFDFEGRRGNLALYALVLPLLVLIFPIFKETFRKSYWDSRILIFIFFTLIINILLLLIMYANKEYYWSDWVGSGNWARRDSPPIIWDFWNII